MGMNWLKKKRRVSLATRLCLQTLRQFQMKICSSIGRGINFSLYMKQFLKLRPKKVAWLLATFFLHFWQEADPSMMQDTSSSSTGKHHSKPCFFSAVFGKFLGSSWTKMSKIHQLSVLSRRCGAHLFCAQNWSK